MTACNFVAFLENLNFTSLLSRLQHSIIDTIGHRFSHSTNEYSIAARQCKGIDCLVSRIIILLWGRSQSTSVISAIFGTPLPHFSTVLYFFFNFDPPPLKSVDFFYGRPLYFFDGFLKWFFLQIFNFKILLKEFDKGYWIGCQKP